MEILVYAGAITGVMLGIAYYLGYMDGWKNRIKYEKDNDIY